jgi:hypothetical protein
MILTKFYKNLSLLFIKKKNAYIFSMYLIFIIIDYKEPHNFYLFKPILIKKISVNIYGNKIKIIRNVLNVFD